MTDLVISDISIRQDAAGRFRLNDFHKASGGLHKHMPSEWLRNQQTRDLIDEIVRTGNPVLEQNQPVKVVNGGNQQGTFAVKELIYAYAMWINPAFHLRVIRAFDTLVTGRPALTAPIAPLPPPPPETVTLTKDAYIAQQAELNALLKSRIELLELKASTQPRKKNLTAPEKRNILALRDKGYTVAQIAEETGRTRATIQSYLRNLQAQGGAA
jgi:hypothetical protein